MPTASAGMTPGQLRGWNPAILSGLAQMQCQFVVGSSLGWQCNCRPNNRGGLCRLQHALQFQSFLKILRNNMGNKSMPWAERPW